MDSAARPDSLFDDSVFPAPTPVEVPEDLTADKTLAILEAMVAGMEKAMSDMFAHARAEGISDAMKAMEEFQSPYMEHVEQMTQAQMKLHGISQEVYRICYELDSFVGIDTVLVDCNMCISDFHGSVAEAPH